MGRRPEMLDMSLPFVNTAFVNTYTSVSTKRREKWKVRIYTCLGITKLQPSVTLTSECITDDKFCPELELTAWRGFCLCGDRTWILKAEEFSGGCFARRKHFLVYSCIFLNVQHPPTDKAQETPGI